MYYGVENRETLYGFRTGELAGLTREERARRQRENARRDPFKKRLLVVQHQGLRHAENTEPLFTNAQPGSSLEEALRGVSLTDLRAAARSVGISLKGITRKNDVVSKLSQELPTAFEAFEEFMTNTDTKSFETHLRLLRGEALNYDDINASLVSRFDWSPFFLVCKAVGKGTCFMPDELRKGLSILDFEPLSAERSILDLVSRALDIATTFCGLVHVDDLYEMIVRSPSGAMLGGEEFEKALGLLTEGFGTRQFLWTDGDVRYVAHWRLSGSRIWYDDQSYSRDLGSPTPAWAHRHDAELGEQPWPSNRISLLAERHRAIASRIESLVMGSEEAADLMYKLPSVVALSEYFDAHVPWGSNELTFSDDMIDMLVKSFLFENQSLGSILEWLTKKGWYLAEGTNSAPRLTKLICDLSRELPRWEYNGWSEREYLDMLSMPCIISETQPFEGEDSNELSPAA